MCRKKKVTHSSFLPSLKDEDKMIPTLQMRKQRFRGNSDGPLSRVTEQVVGGPGLHPRPPPPAASWSPRGNANGPALLHPLRKYALDFHRRRGCSRGSRGPACCRCNKQKVTRIRGEIFIHSGGALRAPRRERLGREPPPVRPDYLETPEPLSMLSPLSVLPMPTLLP